MNEITAQVTSKTKISIKGKNEKIDLNEPLFAINWFATKMEWLYHFYNLLAAKSVFKVGGKPIFKGKITEIIMDQYSGDRDLLLIVKYPGGQEFKTMLESTYFKLVSILRIAAVKNFTFGFTHPLSMNKKSKPKDGLYYLVHHFKYNDLKNNPLNDLSSLQVDQLSITYSGNMVASLHMESEGKSNEVSSIMDGIVVWQSNSQDSLRELVNTQFYTKIINGLDASYIGFVNRLI